MARRDGIQLNIPEEWYEEALELVEPQLDEAAHAVADSISGVRVTVTASRNRSGRPTRLVTLAEAKGIAMDAKNGTLARAAAAKGLDVTRYDQS